MWLLAITSASLTDKPLILVISSRNRGRLTFLYANDIVRRRKTTRLHPARTFGGDGHHRFAVCLYRPQGFRADWRVGDQDCQIVD